VPFLADDMVRQHLWLLFNSLLRGERHCFIFALFSGGDERQSILYQPAARKKYQWRQLHRGSSRKAARSAAAKKSKNGNGISTYQ